MFCEISVLSYVFEQIMRLDAEIERLVCSKLRGW